MDYLLGGERLVWRAWRIRLAAMGVVGRGTGASSHAFALAFSLAGALRLPADYRRLSLHDLDVAPCVHLAGFAHHIRGTEDRPRSLERNPGHFAEPVPLSPANENWPALYRRRARNRLGGAGVAGAA